MSEMTYDLSKYWKIPTKEESRAHFLETMELTDYYEKLEYRNKYPIQLIKDHNVIPSDHDPVEDYEIYQKYDKTMWVNLEKKILNENTFAMGFTELNNLQYNNGLFYSKEGKKTEDSIAKDIWESIKGADINQNVAQVVSKLLGAVKLAASVEKLEPPKTVIPFSNGDLDITERKFYWQRFNPSPYRLPVKFLYDYKVTPNFNKWLNDLFMDEDIPTIRQFLGYCLIPSTKAQKSLFLVGEGGAGKSVIGAILQGLLGDAMLSTASTQEFINDKFKLAELENKLVLYDDDLDSKALTNTGLYKKLITNTQAITADRKYGQPFRFTPQIKIVSCCNEMVSSIGDQTQGFYRRLHPVLIKPIAEDFEPDLHFYDKIKKEIPDILGFAMVGLFELIDNDFNLHTSQRTIDYLKGKQAMENPYPEFLESCFDFDESYEVSTVDIKNVLDYWARQNGVENASSREFDRWLCDNLEQFSITRSNKIKGTNGYIRGIKGMKIKIEWQLNYSFK